MGKAGGFSKKSLVSHFKKLSRGKCSSFVCLSRDREAKYLVLKNISRWRRSLKCFHFQLKTESVMNSSLFELLVRDFFVLGGGGAKCPYDPCPPLVRLIHD